MKKQNGYLKSEAVSLCEMRYKKFAAEQAAINLQLDEVVHTKRNIRKEMIKGYMVLLSEMI